MRGGLSQLVEALPLPWLEIRPRPDRQGAIKLSPLEALPEPQKLGRLKKVIVGRGSGAAERQVEGGDEDDDLDPLD